MDTRQALKNSRSILDELGLEQWGISLDRAKTRAGVCHHSKSLISLSEHFVALNEWERVQTTLLHEAAHALAGPGAGHGYQWVVQCRRLGIQPERCFTLADTAMPEGNVVVSCPNHGDLGTQHRMPRRNARSYKVCRKCRTRLEYRRAA